MVVPNAQPLTMLNLSEGGMLFLADRNLPIGTLLDLTFTIPGSRHEIVASGRVVRIEETKQGKFEAGIRIVDIAAGDQKTLSRYIRETQANSGEKSAVGSDARS